jgi:hypothetical protein
MIPAVHDSPTYSAGLRKQSPPLYPKMLSFSGADRQFSTFEKENDNASAFTQISPLNLGEIHKPFRRLLAPPGILKLNNNCS